MVHKKHKKQVSPSSNLKSPQVVEKIEEAGENKFNLSPQNKESFISIVLGVLVVIVIGVLVFNYFKNLNKTVNIGKQVATETQLTGAVGPETTPTQAQALKTGTYKVKTGDGLWNIAVNVYNDGYKWVDIAKSNNLADPYIITEGQILKIPKLEIKKGDINGAGISTASPLAITSSSYKVVADDCLWNIAVRACGDGYKWTKLAIDNKIENPDLIHPGNVFKIRCK